MPQAPSNVPAVNKVAEFKQLVKSANFQESIKKVIPKWVDIERLAMLWLFSAQRNPKICECTKSSIIAALTASAELGLECSGITGEGYLIPYMNRKKDALELQFQPGYQGLTKNAMKSNKRILNIRAEVVYEKDVFNIIKMPKEHVVHEIPTPWDRGKIVGCYAVCDYDDGTMQFEPMSKKQVDEIRNRSKAKDSGPWVTDYEMMMRKTPQKRLCNRLAKVDDPTDLLAKTVAHDNEVEFGEGRQVVGAVKTDSSEALYETLVEGVGEPMDAPTDAEFEEVPEPEPPPEPRPKATAKKTTRRAAPPGPDPVQEGFPIPDPPEQEPTLPGEDREDLAAIWDIAKRLGISRAFILDYIGGVVPAQWGEEQIDDIRFALHQISKGVPKEEAFPAK